jgi:hypothetical protein
MNTLDERMKRVEALERKLPAGHPDLEPREWQGRTVSRIWLAELTKTDTDLQRERAPADVSPVGKMSQEAAAPYVLNDSFIEALAEGVADVVKQSIDRGTGLDAQLLAIFEKRLALLESGRRMTFKGPHDPAAAYAAGDVVQRAGATWCALVNTSDKPGDSASWRRIGTDR